MIMMMIIAPNSRAHKGCHSHRLSISIDNSLSINNSRSNFEFQATNIDNKNCRACPATATANHLSGVLGVFRNSSRKQASDIIKPRLFSWIRVSYCNLLNGIPHIKNHNVACSLSAGGIGCRRTGVIPS